MTKSQLPEITLTCPDGHPFTTRATGGQSVSCKTCGRSKRVPTDRPRTAREAASYAAPAAIVRQDPEPVSDPDPAAELADRWQLETPWSGALTLAPARSPDDECPECEGPLSWEPRRTLTYCPECKHIELPPAVTAYYAREQAQRAIVAVRQQNTIADPAQEKTARARLRALKIREQQWAEELIETIGDPDSYDRIQWQREARDFTATMRGWMPELKNAETEAELADTKRIILAELINSQPGKELWAEYDAAINRAEHAELMRQRAEEIEQAEAEATAERMRQQKALEASRNNVRTPATSRAITATPQYKAPDAAIMIATMIEQSRRNKAERAAKIERNGQCGWCRKPTPATRAYGVGYQQYGWGSNGLTLALDRPNTRACSKHYEQAEQQAEQQNAGIKVYYWELT